MGWDVKATADGIVQSLPDISTMNAESISLPQAAHWIIMALLVLAVASVLVKLLPKVWAAVEQVMFSNWRLALIGTAALVMSAASGWVTWDGMRNFTGESVLSAMFTFGIQAVMLITAWLIGESFATGMNQMRGKSERVVSPPLVALTLLGLVLVVAAAVTGLILYGMSQDQLFNSLAVAGLLILAVAGVLIFSRSDVIRPYTQGTRIIAKNAMLWVMFLVCMSTSVFFSFDSRFNVIFPEDQRERAAEIRTKNQVAGVVADIGETISSRRITEADTLFRSAGWGAYDTQLAALSRASEGAEREIEAHFTRQMEAHRSAIAAQQERIATATSGQAGLAGKKITLTDELSRLKAERPGLAADVAAKKSELDARAREVDAKRVEAMAEEKGVEGTLKVGRGPIYRERMAELARLRDYYKIGEERVRDAEKRLVAVDSRITEIERELAGVDGELAKLRGEAETAGQRIAAAESSQLNQEGQTVDPARVRAAFERARIAFRQQPDAEHLASLHQHCAQLYDAMISTDATKDRVRDIDCDPKQAVEAAAVVFALNAGLKAYQSNCAGGDKLPAVGGVDVLLGFGRRCLQDSGLPSADSTAMGAKLSSIDLNRDDKAHNFVVSLNAFQDGNSLAYLALAIAIGIDSLIFMSGLFGANTVRSPLTDVPSLKARNSQQLNAMIETALLPDTFRKARLVVQAMHPINNVEGYSNEVLLDQLDPETAVQARDVLNAGAIIGAVRKGERAGQYLVRSELLEFLNTVIKRELERDPDRAQQGMAMDQFEDQVVVALLPDVAGNCEAVMGALVPMDESRGFTAHLDLDEIDDGIRPVALNVLNTGATFSKVQRRSADSYYVHKDLYKTLARIRAREVGRVGGPLLAGPRKAAAGGALREAARPQLTDQTHRHVEAEKTNDDDERRRAMSALVGSLGLDANVYFGLTDSAWDAGHAAANALEDVWNAVGGLRREFLETSRAYSERVERARAQEEYALEDDDGTKRQILNEAFDELGQAWPVVMLLKGGPFERTIQEIVDEPDVDRGEGDQMMVVADRIAKEFAVNPRIAATDWTQLEALFAQLARGSAQQMAEGDIRRTLN